MAELDVLRAIAVFMVFGRHWQVSMDGAWAPAVVCVKCWYNCGWAGVDLFFVLSGFLVSGLLFREYIRHGDVKIGRFLIRRGLKIYPAFYVFLAITILVPRILGRTPDVPSFLCEAFFVQNYGPSLWSHTWSLAVEEHFYLLLSLCVYLVVRKRPVVQNPFNGATRMFCSIAMGCLILRGIWYIKYPYYWKPHTTSTHLRIDALSFGVWLSYLYHYHFKSLKHWVEGYRSFIFLITAVILSAIVFMDNGSFAMYTIGRTLVYMAFGGVLMLALFARARKQRLSCLAGVLAGIGTYSYSIYLWHIVAFWLLVVFNAIFGFKLPLWPSLAVYVVGAVLMGITASKVVEWPVLRIRDKLIPSRSYALAQGVRPAAEQTEHEITKRLVME